MADRDAIRIDAEDYSLDLGQDEHRNHYFLAVQFGVGTPLVKMHDRGNWIVLPPVSQVSDHHAAFEEVRAALRDGLQKAGD